MSDEPESEAMARARARGRELMSTWCTDGTLVDAAEVARRRGAPVTEIETDSLVVIQHDGQTRYLACVLDLPVDNVKQINVALGSADNAARVLWWTRRHGVLSATTVPDAIRAGRVARCLELAQGYAEEHGDVQPGGMDG